MKTKMIIEIETPNAEEFEIMNEDNYDEFGECDENKKLEFKKQFAIDLHNYAKNIIEKFIGDAFNEEFMDNLEELSIENWENIDDYGVKIKIIE